MAQRIPADQGAGTRSAHRQTSPQQQQQQTHGRQRLNPFLFSPGFVSGRDGYSHTALDTTRPRTREVAGGRSIPGDARVAIGQDQTVSRRVSELIPQPITGDQFDPLSFGDPTFASSGFISTGQRRGSNPDFQPGQDSNANPSPAWLAHPTLASAPSSLAPSPEYQARSKSRLPGESSTTDTVDAKNRLTHRSTINTTTRNTFDSRSTRSSGNSSSVLAGQRSERARDPGEHAEDASLQELEDLLDESQLVLADNTVDRRGGLPGNRASSSSTSTSSETFTNPLHSRRYSAETGRNEMHIGSGVASVNTGSLGGGTRNSRASNKNTGVEQYGDGSSKSFDGEFDDFYPADEDFVRSSEVVGGGGKSLSSSSSSSSQAGRVPTPVSSVLASPPPHAVFRVTGVTGIDPQLAISTPASPGLHMSGGGGGRQAVTSHPHYPPFSYPSSRHPVGATSPYKASKPDANMGSPSLAHSTNYPASALRTMVSPPHDLSSAERSDASFSSRSPSRVPFVTYDTNEMSTLQDQPHGFGSNDGSSGLNKVHHRGGIVAGSDLELLDSMGNPDEIRSKFVTDARVHTSGEARGDVDGRTPANGDLASRQTPSQHRGRQLWQRNQYGEFSPLPMFSSGDEEEEADGRGGGGGAGAGNHGGRRRPRGKFGPPPLRHCHKRRVGSLTDPLARRQLIAVVVLCLVFMVGEAVGGALANSLALFTDVLHLGSDLVSFIISLLAMWLSNKPATRRMSFGYHRAEVLGALLSVFIIWLVSGVLCYMAVERIMEEHYKDVKPNEMLITASVGVVINFIMGFVLHSEICCGHAHSHNTFGHGHSHSHGHSHGHGGHSNGHGHSHGGSRPVSNPGYDYADDKGLLDVRSSSTSSADALVSTGQNRSGSGLPSHYSRAGGGGGFEPGNSRTRESFDYQPMDEGTESQQLIDFTAHEHHDDGEAEDVQLQQKNINVRAAFIHVVGDIIQSIGVLVAALIIKFTDDPRFRLADPICTFLFSLLVLITTVAVLRDTLLVMLEAVPRGVALSSLKRELAAVEGVVAVHSLHVWALTLGRNAVSVHLAIDDPHLHSQVLSSAQAVTQDRHHFFSSTIQVELYDHASSQDCSECTEF